MNLDRKPLPRFWYLPRGEKAAVVMTGDDHGNGGTDGRFDRFEAASPAGCSVADWECVRATSYVYPDTPITRRRGGRLPGRRLRDRACTSPRAAQNFTPRLAAATTAATQLPQFAATLARPRGAAHEPHALHRLERLGERAQGRARPTASGSTRTTTTGPAAWVQDRPGMFTGSGMPMRFADSTAR